MPQLLEAVARRLASEGLGGVRLVVSEQASIGTDYIGPILHKPGLMPHVGALALHAYGDASVAANVNTVRRSDFPNTPVWLTEYGDLNDLDRTAGNEWKSFCLNSNRRALTALNTGATAVFYFNAFDDYEECMQRHTYYGLFTSAGHLYTPRKRYWAAKHLFRMVKPGSQRIAVSATAPGLTVSAFRDDSANTMTVVGVKEGGPNHLRLSVRNLKSPAPEWELYVTTRELDFRRVESFTATEGVVEFDLPNDAVFTLVARASSKPGGFGSGLPPSQ
jgi:hypothetical protein